jgi:hypothetical protein
MGGKMSRRTIQLNSKIKNKYLYLDHGRTARLRKDDAGEASRDDTPGHEFRGEPRHNFLFPKAFSGDEARVRFTSRISLEKADRFHKTGRYYSSLQVARILGIHPRTLSDYEGRLFPKARRLTNGYRIFTFDEMKAIKRTLKL